MPEAFRNYLAQVDFRDQSSSASSNVTDDSYHRKRSRKKNGDGSPNGEVEDLLRNRLQRRIGGEDAARECKAAALVEELGQATEADQGVFEAVVMQCGLWSKGCAQHSTRKCRPCHYVHCRTGCSNGAECEFCHFPHTDKNRQRIGMSKRLFCKQIAGQMEEACYGDDAKFQQVVRASSSMSSYLHGILVERLAQQRFGGPSPGASSSRGGHGEAKENRDRSNIVSL